MATVTDLLDKLAAGKMTVDEVAKNFATRDWPDRKPATDGQAWGHDDVDEPDPDSWDAVNADSRLTSDQYAQLSDAYAQARAPRK